jgi:hypothetical protein
LVNGMKGSGERGGSSWTVDSSVVVSDAGAMVVPGKLAFIDPMDDVSLDALFSVAAGRVETSGVERFAACSVALAWVSGGVNAS